MKRTCEICGDEIQQIENAKKCGHKVYLCEICKRECPGALDYCVKCEDKH